VKREGFIEADTGLPMPTATNYKLREIERNAFDEKGEPSRQTVVLRKGYLSAGVIHALRFLTLHSPRLSHMIIELGDL
jgi:hypothetical protein